MFVIVFTGNVFPSYVVGTFSSPERAREQAIKLRNDATEVKFYGQDFRIVPFEFDRMPK